MASGSLESLARIKLPERIPVFPVAGALLLPHTQLPLNVFEPRYLAMVDDARQNGGWIGMIQPRGEGHEPPLYSIGCVGRIGEYSETDDGRYIMSLVGISRFEIQEELGRTTKYRQVLADYSRFTDDLEPSTDIDPTLRTALIEDLRTYLEFLDFRIDWEEVEAAHDEALVNAIAILAPFEVAEKQALLEAQTLTERAKIAQTLLRFAILEDDSGPAH